MSFDNEGNPRAENAAVRKLVLYVLGIVVISTVLLTINTGMIFSLATAVQKILPDVMFIPQLIQLTIFTGPILLLYLEWYVWDIMSARRIRSRASDHRSA